MPVLDGIRILELSQGLTGPYCAQMAADMGAGVVKVEPLGGDYTRQWGASSSNGESISFITVNRNKRSVALDIGTVVGRNALRELIAQSDVVIEDLTPAEAKRLKLTYEENRRDHADLIQIHVDYYGDLGPRRNEEGAELPAQAMLDYPGGLGAIGEPPVRVGCDLGSMNASVFAFQGMLAALIERDSSGEGQHVAVSAAGALAFLKTFIIAAPSDPDEWGGFHLEAWTKPRNHGYKTKDGEVVMDLRFRSATSETPYEDLMKEMGLTDLLQDPRFAVSADVAGTGKYAPQLHSIWEEHLKEMTSEEVLTIVRKHGAECFEITNYRSIAEHPQTAALGILREVPHPSGGTFKTIGNPWKFGDGERAQDSAPPTLGRDTDAVLTEAGVSTEVIADLRGKGAIR